MTNADRQRAYRQRRAEGIAVLPVAIDLDRVSECLVEAGLLLEWDATDREKIADAIAAAVDVWARNA